VLLDSLNKKLPNYNKKYFQVKKEALNEAIEKKKKDIDKVIAERDKAIKQKIVFVNSIDLNKSYDDLKVLQQDLNNIFEKYKKGKEYSKVIEKKRKPIDEVLFVREELIEKATLFVNNINLNDLVKKHGDKTGDLVCEIDVLINELDNIWATYKGNDNYFAASREKLCAAISEKRKKLLKIRLKGIYFSAKSYFDTIENSDSITSEQVCLEGYFNDYLRAIDQVLAIRNSFNADANLSHSDRIDIDDMCEQLKKELIVILKKEIDVIVTSLSPKVYIEKIKALNDEGEVRVQKQRYIDAYSHAQRRVIDFRKWLLGKEPKWNTINDNYKSLNKTEGDELRRYSVYKESVLDSSYRSGLAMLNAKFRDNE
jgi:guanylate kinase